MLYLRHLIDCHIRSVYVLSNYFLWNICFGYRISYWYLYGDYTVLEMAWYLKTTLLMNFICFPVEIYVWSCMVSMYLNLKSIQQYCITRKCPSVKIMQLFFLIDSSYKYKITNLMPSYDNFLTVRRMLSRLHYSVNTFFIVNIVISVTTAQ